MAYAFIPVMTQPATTTELAHAIRFLSIDAIV